MIIIRHRKCGYFFAVFPLVAIYFLCCSVLAAESLTPTSNSDHFSQTKKSVKNTLDKKKKPSVPEKKKKTSNVKIYKNMRKSIQRSWDFQDPARQTLPNTWDSISGEWDIIAEPEHPGNRVLRQKSVKRNFQYCVSRQKFVNFEFSVKMRTDRFEQKTRNWQMGLIFRQADPNYYYKFRITAANMALIRCSPHAENVLPSQLGNSQVASATGRFGKSDERMLMILPWKSGQDEWHTLTVVCYGERIILKVDGREIRMLDDAMIGCGRVGVFSYKTQAFFDDLRLFYLPVPETNDRLVVSDDVFSLKNKREILIYYENPKIGPVQMKVLDSRQKMFAILTQGIHYQGIGSVIWNGQNLDGSLPKPGTYTIVLNAAGKKRTKTIEIRP